MEQRPSYVDLTELLFLEDQQTVAEEQTANEDGVDSSVSDLKYPANEDLSFPEEFQLELDYFDNEQQEDKLWKARTGLNEKGLSAAIETIIFMSDRPISLAKIKNLIDEDLPLRVIYQAIHQLQQEYENQHHGIRLAEVAEGYQFRTKATYSRFVSDLFKIHTLMLSPTALEVLAIIAYRQPVSKVEVEKIRGVDSSHIVRALMDKRLVKVEGRSEEVGRPVLYSTTPEFLEVFGLPNIESLPPEHELSDMATTGVGKISDIKTLVHTGDKKRFAFDELSELDELSAEIKNISSDTEFTKNLKEEEKKRQSDNGEFRSAFDLLEDFIAARQVKEANICASQSELISAGGEPTVIRDLEAGPFNTPEDIEEFEMIDLNTGEPIQEINLGEPDEDEASRLAKALEEAFSRLSTQLPADEDEDFDLEGANLKIDQAKANLKEKGKELDIDLDFID